MKKRALWLAGLAILVALVAAGCATPTPEVIEVEGPERVVEVEVPAPAGPALGSAERPIQVLFIPSVDVGVLVSGGEVMDQFLTDATGLEFEVAVPTSYAATVESMCASPEDTMGFISALVYVLASNRCDVTVSMAAVRFGLSWYTTQFLVARDSDIETLEDLAGKTWAAPSLTSTSGYLYPSVVFANLGIEPGESVEAGGHPQAVMAVYNGEVEFATSFFSPPGMPSGSWSFGDDPEPYDVEALGSYIGDDGRLYVGDFQIRDARSAVRETAPDVVEKVRILDLSQQIPNDTLSFGPEFPVGLQAQIVRALLAFVDDPRWDESIGNPDHYDWSSLEPVTASFYDPVRDLIEVLGYTDEDILG
ncbi:MAG: PhnD/SsuA/transferrin family substrate-binding protein [Anaerolineae bacterium]